MAAIDKIKYFALAAAAILCSVAFCGCSDDVGFTLLRTELSLTVGDTRDITPYIAFVPATRRAAVTAESDDECVIADGCIISAVGAGKANITVRVGSSSAVMTVVCAYGSPQKLDITADNLVQTVAAGSKPLPVNFSAQTGDISDPEVPVVWTVGDITHTGRDFAFTPPDHGEYCVSAAYGGMTATRTVSVYRPSETEIKVDGALVQTGDFSPVIFTAREKIDTLNPPSVYVWSVNGREWGRGAAIEFTPSEAGEYKVTLTVNGAEKGGVTVTASGERAPKGRIEFDDEYGVKVRWSDGRGVRYISIISPDGKRETYDATDANCAHLFGRGEIDVSELIAPCAQDPGEYRIILGGRAQSEFAFTQLEARAEKYLNDVVLCKNSYIDDAEEAEYYVGELYACGKTHGECYIACDASSAEAAMRAAADRLGLSAEIRVEGNIASVELGDYVNAPSGAETPTVTTAYAELPHINFDQTAVRSNGYVFASDRRERSVAVDGTEELLLAVTGGLRPEPRSGSAAYTAYRAAKSVLLGIIGAEYTVRQKIHAIYDWLQWVSVKSYTLDRNMASNYLEGVFCTTRVGGSGYAVTSAGAAKAFALMCAVEGIDCTVETGEDGYMYNTVAMDGLLYNVDVFGGKVSAFERGANVSSELTSHRGLFFVTDRIPSAFDMSGSVYLQKTRRGDLYFDNYIDAAECADEDMIFAAVQSAFDSVATGSVRVPYPDSEVLTYNNSYGVEFCYRGDDVAAFSALIERAAAEYARTILGATFSRIRVEVIGDKVFLTAVAPYTE